jgi:DNA-binding MarR family transcriptional regulator
VNEHLKEIRSGYLRAVGAGLASLTAVALPQDWLRALGVSWSDTTIRTIRAFLFVAGVALVTFQFWRYTKRTGGRIAVLEKEVARLNREVSRLKAPIKLDTTAPKPKPELPEIQQRILLILSAVESMSDAEIAKQIQVGQHVADHHLDKLYQTEMIWAEFATYGTPIYWQLMPPGRDYLIERGLLK